MQNLARNGNKTIFCGEDGEEFVYNYKNDKWEKIEEIQKKCRIGTLVISEIAFREEYELVKKIFEEIGMLPYDVEHPVNGELFRFTGESKCFREIYGGAEIPFYTVIYDSYKQTFEIEEM